MISAVACQSINDVFSATYNNYRIVWEATASTGLSVYFRMRVGGADNSSAQYDFASYGSSAANSTYIQSAQGDTGFGYLGRTEASSTKQTTVVLDVIKPFASDFNTVVQGQFMFPKNSNNPHQITYAGQMRVQTSYTGFTFFPDSGTLTGTVRVYGYNQ